MPYKLTIKFLVLFNRQPLALVHAHFARQPEPPHAVNLEIPAILSRLILKLLAKNAEDRYQSAFGLKADLEKCWAQWQENGRITTFPLGLQDISDQFQRNIPYASIIQAFRALIRQLLTESEQGLAQWKQKLRTALGQNGQIIVDVIPEIELILGKQPALPDLPPSESLNRFNHVFRSFIHIFTQREHPLVLFLDDLQWADTPSLKLMQSLLTAPDSGYLFLIGAYRDNEVGAGHPLQMMLDDLTSETATVSQITLSPLDLADVTQFVADTLHSPAEEVGELSELILQKTGGNPFFISEFLKSLHRTKLLEFDLVNGRWQWQLEKIEAQQITDNVVELMADKAQELEAETQAVLKLAACISWRKRLKSLRPFSPSTLTTKPANITATKSANSANTASPQSGKALKFWSINNFSLAYG